jgi:hypothetical protein
MRQKMKFCWTHCYDDDDDDDDDENDVHHHHYQHNCTQMEKLFWVEISCLTSRNIIH